MSLLKTIRMMASASLWLITPFLPSWSRSLSKWLRMGHFPQSPPPHLRFQVSGPDLYQAVKRSWQLGATSSPHRGRLHCLLQRAPCGGTSCPVAVHTGRCDKSLWSTASKVKLCGTWVKLSKNTIRHLILLIVAIRRELARQQKAKWRKWQTAVYPQKRGVQALPLECWRHHVVLPSIWSSFSRSHKKKQSDAL